MCGIAGIYGFRDDNLLNEFSEKLKHRGPDGLGTFISEKISLLNRRLAIIDIKNGDQPIFNEDKTVVVVYNGEIYNFSELRFTLEKFGHVFKTQSDTEVIVHGYEQWGKDCFDRLNGMFAIGLCDKKRDKLILVRDHFGIKPLYYSKKGSKVIFSSEIKPIFESGFIEKKPNERIIYRYLKYRVHDDNRETFFKNIYKLLPGELAEIQNSKFEVQRYSRLEEELLAKKKSKKFDESSVAEFKDKLINAIKIRLVSEVPVGSCLSGGIDSSTVVSCVNMLIKNKTKEASSVGKRQKTFSAVFPEGTNNEERYINELIDFTNVKNYKVRPQPEEFFKEIENFIRTQEEPTISTGPYAQYKVMEEAQHHVTVLLDGQGADETLAGYIPYYKVYFKQLLDEKKYFMLVKELLFSFDFIKKAPTDRAIVIDNLLDKEFMDKYKKERFETVENNLKKRLVEDIFKNSLPSLLRYEDRNSMRFSLEGRVPFLDKNLLEYLFSLPDTAIINCGWNKNILREATKNMLPVLINKRRNKIGFTTPEYQWFMRMKNKIYQIFLSESFAKRPYFNQKKVLEAFQLFIEGKYQNTMVFWRLLNLEFWFRIFFDKEDHQAKNYRETHTRKKVTILVDGKEYHRFPVKTELFKKGDDYAAKISKSLLQCFKTLEWKKIAENKFFIVVSEKIVAISQGRSYFLWEIKPSFPAKILSRYVTKTPYGIGLGSPWTMQLAIQESGLARILASTVAAALTKPFGIKGVFYKIAGTGVAAIDGPTEYSLYPSNVSAKLGPKNPQAAARKIESEIRNKLSSNFQGVVIIDANDIGRKVLGNTTGIADEKVEKIFSDNPMGQADEQTPVVIVSGI